jgi:hypothetical protein
LSLIQTVINTLIVRGHLDIDATTITDQLRLDYAKVYAELTGGDYNNLKSSNRKYALKLAGLNLSKALSVYTSGFVYCIVNPAFDGYVKVGITKDINNRLAVYQTGDPNRAYRIECYRFVEDKREVEKYLLEKYRANADTGEWVNDQSVIEYVRSLS